MQKKSPYKYLRDIKRITKFIERKCVENSPKLSINVQYQIDIRPSTPFLTISKPTIVDIQPELTKPNLSTTQHDSISKHPSQNPPKFEQLFTAEDFKRCANETGMNSRQRHQERKQERERERERDLANFRRILNLPP